ncbi:hypothetical protein HK101_007637 [Irineochytrium annulatum]|nr:hypothetical protein HK101_007637 [Irineochytrium annulatum]
MSGISPAQLRWTTQLSATVAEQNEVAAKRFSTAVQKVGLGLWHSNLIILPLQRQEERTKEQMEDEAKLATMRTIANIEQQRAMAAARKRRLRGPPHISEFASNPVELMNRSRILETPGLQYDTTLFHRDFACVRALPAADASTRCLHDAKVAQEEAAAALRAKDIAAGQHRMEANGRYVRAITQRNRDRRRDDLCAALEHLQMDDRKRKHDNAAKNAVGKRVSFVQHTEEFRKHFSIDNKAQIGSSIALELS